MKKLYFRLSCCLLAFALAGCASAPKPPRPSIRDANYRLEMRAQYDAENRERVEQLRSLVPGSITIDEFERKFLPKSPSGENEKWIIHLVQRQLRSTPKKDGSISTDALYYMGTGFQIGTIMKVYGYVADIDCVAIFVEGSLREIRWHPQVELVPGQTGISRVLQLVGGDFPGVWNYSAYWFFAQN